MASGGCARHGSTAGPRPRRANRDRPRGREWESRSWVSVIESRGQCRTAWACRRGIDLRRRGAGSPPARSCTFVEVFGPVAQSVDGADVRAVAQEHQRRPAGARRKRRGLARERRRQHADAEAARRTPARSRAAITARSSVSLKRAGSSVKNSTRGPGRRRTRRTCVRRRRGVNPWRVTSWSAAAAARIRVASWGQVSFRPAQVGGSWVRARRDRRSHLDVAVAARAAASSAPADRVSARLVVDHHGALPNR